MDDGDGAGGVGADELQEEALAAAGVGAGVAVALLGDIANDAAEVFGGEGEVDEARAGHLDLPDDVLGDFDVGDEHVGDLAGGATDLAGEGEGDGGGDVAVLWVAGCLELYARGDAVGDVAGFLRPADSLRQCFDDEVSCHDRSDVVSP